MFTSIPKRIDIPPLPGDLPTLAFAADRVARMRRIAAERDWAPACIAKARALAAFRLESVPAGPDGQASIPPMPDPGNRNRHAFAIAQAATFLYHLDHDPNMATRGLNALRFGLTHMKTIWWQPASFRLVQAADGLWPTLDEPQRGELQTMLREALAAAPNAMATNNIGAGHRKAMLAVALMCNDRDLADEAINHPTHGTLALLREGLAADGLWDEAAPSYHCYALVQFLETALLADWANIPLLEAIGPPLLQACRAVFGLLDAQLRMPDTGDTWRAPLGQNENPTDSLSGSALMLELASNLFDDPWVNWALLRTPRHTLDSVIYARESLTVASPPTRSVLYPDSGHATLRSPATPAFFDSDALTAYLRFGPSGGWHGHRDALALELSALGKRMIADRGRAAAYANPVHWHWHRTTLAHSTVVIDHQDQSEDQKGDCPGWVESPNVSAIAARCPRVYSGFDYQRRVVLTPRYLVDCFDVRAHDGKPHVYHHVTHGQGTFFFDLRVRSIPNPNRGDGYPYLSNLRAVDWRSPLITDLKQGSWDSNRFADFGTGMMLQVIRPTDGAAMLASVPTAQNTGFEDCLIIESVSEAARFITLAVPYRGAASPVKVTPLDADHALTLRIDHQAGHDIVVFAVENEATLVQDDVHFVGTFLTLMRDANNQILSVTARGCRNLIIGNRRLRDADEPGEVNV